MEKAWWNNRKENQYAWKVSYKDIEAQNFNLDYANPHEEEKVEADPEQLMIDYRQIVSEVDTIRIQLKNELEKALGKFHD